MQAQAQGTSVHFVRVSPSDAGNLFLSRKIDETLSAKEGAVTALVDTLVHASRTHDPSEGCLDDSADKQGSRIDPGEHLNPLVMPRNSSRSARADILAEAKYCDITSDDPASPWVA